MSFHIVTIELKSLITDPLQRPIFYRGMMHWCEMNICPPNAVNSDHYWFPRAFRGNTGTYKMHFRNEDDYQRFCKHFNLT